MKRLVAVGALAPSLVLALALAGPARAASPADVAAAQHLFDEAKRKAEAGEHAAACPLLEESQRLDPALGTAFNLSDCYERTGRTASAWTAFLDVAAQAKAAGKAERERAARERAAALEPRLVRVAIVVGDATPELEVRRDGSVVGRAAWSLALPVDPGEHTVSASAPGRATWSTKVSVKEHDAPLTVRVPRLAPSSRAESPAAGGPPSPASPAAQRGPLGAQRTVALVVAGVGVLGVGLGTAFGLSSMSKNGQAKGLCDPSLPCRDPAGVAAWNDAYRAGTTSTVAFAAGGALLAGAAVLWLTGAPASPSGGVALSIGPGAARASGAW